MCDQDVAAWRAELQAVQAACQECMAGVLFLQAQTLHEMERVGTLWIKAAELGKNSVGTLRIEARCVSR